MSYRIVWSDHALSDLDGAFDQLFLKSPIAANELIEKVFKKTEQLLEFPKSGPVELRLSHLSEEYRYLIESNFKILYRVNNDTIFVVRVFDTRRDPEDLKP